MDSSSVVDGVPFDPFVVMTREPRVLVGVATERLEAELCALSAHLDAAMCRFLMMVGEYDRRQGWGEWEARSCAHWLAWKCGIALGTAREHVRVAHTLETMALVREALAAGVLSYSKVRAITRVCRPEIEAALIQVAKDSTATGLERICRAYRRHGEGTDADEPTRAHAERFMVWHYDDDGSLVIRGRVPAEHASTVITMFETARTALEQPTDEARDVPAGTPPTTEADEVDAERQGNVPAGTRPVVREPLAARNADALVLAAEAFLANGPAGVGEGVQLMVIIDEATLTGTARPRDGVCHVEDGPALSSHVARRLACDADVVGVVIDTDGDPACVSHHQRIATRRLRDALRARDGRCQFANCDHRARLQAHHIVHWADGGRTILVNLVLLCAKHHRAVHEGGFTLERAADHRIVVRRPDGQLLTHHHCQADPAVTIETQHRTYGYDIDANTNECGWEGRTPNISDIISHFDTKCRINQHCEGCGEPWFVARQDAGRRPTWLWDEDEDAASGEAGRHNHTNVG